VAVRNLATVQWLQGSPTAVESRPGRIGPISLGLKQTGERSAGNLHAAFDEAGAGNVARSRWCDTRRRKGETTGNTNFDLNRRASPRPYLFAPNKTFPEVRKLVNSRGIDPLRAFSEECRTEMRALKAA
jgi:hypothetical protein